MPDETLSQRESLSDALRVLMDEYPRSGWTQDPGFDDLIQFWLDRHIMFRRLLGEMKSHTERLLDHSTEPLHFGSAVSRYGGMFVNGLHEHHTIEDRYYFPQLIGKDPRLSRGFEILEADHQALDQHLSDFTVAANGALAMLDDRDALQDQAGQLLGELAVLTRLLDRHLIDEEELIVPVILRHGAPDIG